MQATITETQQVLAGMMVENTGAALCDSGDAYGRNWERNQGRTVEDYVAAPDAYFDGDSNGECWGLTVDVFHYLDARLEYVEDLDREFRAFADRPENEHVGWLTLMEEWAANNAGDQATFNSYNDETLLSQTIQGTCFEMGGEWFVLLQIHGGCDVRGGYTAPRVFKILGGNYEMYFDLIAGWNSAWLWAGEDRWDLRGGEWIDQDGTYTPDGPNIEHFRRVNGVWIYTPTGAEAHICADNEW